MSATDGTEDSADDRAANDRAGFGARTPRGERPAIVVVDLTTGFTDPAYPSGTDLTEVVAATARLVAAGPGIPVVYTTTAYQDVDGPNSDIGLWGRKIPCELLQAGSEDVEIDSRIAPADGELVLVKKCASGFHGTNLASYLNAHGVDTVIVTGVTMAGCVRHTTEDAIAQGFRPIVVREAVGDRVPGVVEWNLFDIDAKFGDVEALEDVLAYLDGIAPFTSRVARLEGAVAAP